MKRPKINVNAMLEHRPLLIMSSESCRFDCIVMGMPWGIMLGLVLVCGASGRGVVLVVRLVSCLLDFKTYWQHHGGVSREVNWTTVEPQRSEWTSQRNGE